MKPFKTQAYINSLNRVKMTSTEMDEITAILPDIPSGGMTTGSPPPKSITRTGIGIRLTQSISIPKRGLSIKNLP